MAVVVLVLIVLRTRTSIGDLAVLEIYVEQASRFEQMTGVYSQFGWKHPGPAYLYWLVPFWVASGRTYAGLWLGAWMAGMVSLALSVWLTNRLRSRAAAGAVASAVGAIVVLRDCGTVTSRAFGLPCLANPWNPLVAASLAVLMLVSAWFVSQGWFRVFVVLVGVASLAGQAHAGLLPPAVATTVVAVAAGLWTLANEGNDRGQIWRMIRRPVTGGLAVLTFLWLPAVLEQVSAWWEGGEGNLEAMVRFAVQPRPANGTSEVLAALADALPGPSGWDVAFLVAGIVSAVVLTVRSRDGDLARGLLLLIVMAGWGWWMLRSTAGPVLYYTAFWMWPVSVGFWLVAVATLVRHVQLPDRWMTGVTTIACVVLVLVAAVGAGWSRSYPKTGAPVDRLEGPVRAVVAGRDPVLVRIDEDDAWPVAAGLVRSLVVAGMDVRVSPRWAPVFNLPAGDGNEIVVAVDDADARPAPGGAFVAEEGDVRISVYDRRSR